MSRCNRCKPVGSTVWIVDRVLLPGIPGEVIEAIRVGIETLAHQLRIAVGNALENELVAPDPWE